MREGRAVSVLVAATLLLPSLEAQQPKDPLTESQTDQIREFGDRPNDRIKLYLKFVDERIAAIRDLSIDSHENNRPTELRAKFEEFTRLTDELSDNMDSYTSSHADVRKALKAVTEASPGWPDALLKPPVDPTYEFVRRTALDAAQSSIAEAQRELAEQIAYFAAHKDEAGKNGKAPSPPDTKQ